MGIAIAREDARKAPPILQKLELPVFRLAPRRLHALARNQL
jgi:hypothetical protein